MKLYGTNAATLTWFSCYLSNRQQQCVVEYYTSKPQKVTCGVPQGSILGPLLFLLYINDLPACLYHSKSNMFAEDTIMSAASKSTAELQEMVNKDLDNVKSLLLANKLTLNVNNAEYMLIGTNFNFNLFGNKQVRRLYTRYQIPCNVNYVDHTLKWNKHIGHLCKEVCRSISGLKQVHSFVSREVLIVIYNALIQPHFDYCDIVWGNVNKGLSSK